MLLKMAEGVRYLSARLQVEVSVYLHVLQARVGKGSTH